MNILHTVQFYYPWIGGSEEVVRQISERLAKRGHQVTVATAYDPKRDFEELNGVKIKEFKISGNSVKGIKGEKKKYQDFIINSNYDIIMNYAAQIWSSDIVFELLSNIKSSKIFAPCGYSALKSPTQRVLYWRYYKKLPKYISQYDQMIYHSAIYQDKIFGDKHGIKNYTIIPNGASEIEFKSKYISFKDEYNISTPFMLLSVGTHLRGKGHKFIIESFKKLKRNDVTLVIIGNDLNVGYRRCLKRCEQEANKSEGKIKIFTEIPREHTISAFLEADIFVFGSKVEAFPLVILEAMASKTPFVTTNVGNVRELEGGIIVKYPNEMTQHINELLNDPSERNRLAEKGYKMWKERYTWEKITNKYENLYSQIVVRK